VHIKAVAFFVHCTIVNCRRWTRPFDGKAADEFRLLARSAGRTVMTTEDMQKLGKDNMDMAMNSFGALSKSAQALAVEIADYSKKSFEGSAAAWEKLIGAKSMEKAMQVQSEYLKSSYEDFVAEMTKLGELYVDLAKESYKPFESAMAKASAMK
jgi:phasin family protein